MNLLKPMRLAYKLRVCRAILAGRCWDIARRGVYRDKGLIVISFGNPWTSDRQFGDGRTISTLEDGTTVEVQSTESVWAVDGKSI